MSTQKKIGNAILYKRLGKGAYGEVFLAKEKDKNIFSAMKVISRKLLKEKTDPTSFANRLAMLQSIKHRNCIQIIDKVKTSNNYYIKMEYANGPNLYEYLNYYKKKYNKPLDEAIVQKIVRQISNGLEYLHQKKIIHRDLKLENILLNFDNVKISDKITDNEILEMKPLYNDITKDLFTIKICDFGFSRILDDKDQCSTICGTPLIMAPDIIFKNEEGGAKYGLIADLWSLGVVSYELLIGVPPFNNCKLNALIQDIKKGLFDYPKNLDISLEAVSFINNLLQFDPKKRMNFDKLWDHPFMKTKAEDFHKLKLSLNLSEKDTMQKLKNYQIDSKDNRGMIWLIYDDGSQVGLNLDEVDQNYLEKKLNYKYIPQVKSKKNYGGGLVEDKEVDMRDITDYSFVNLVKKPMKEDKKVPKNFENLEDSDGFVNLDNYYKIKELKQGGNEWEIITDESEEFDNSESK